MTDLAAIEAAFKAELEKQRYELSASEEEMEFGTWDIDWRAMALAAMNVIRDPSGDLLDSIHGCNTVHDWRQMIDLIAGEVERDPYQPLSKPL